MRRRRIGLNELLDLTLVTQKINDATAGPKLEVIELCVTAAATRDIGKALGGEVKE